MEPEEFNRAMGAVIRQQRKLRGWSMESVARKLGYTYQQQQKYEKGVNVLTAHRLTQFAEIFGVTVSSLYEQVGMTVNAPEPSAADCDVIEAVRYMRMIKSAFDRQFSVHLLKKLAYKGAAA